MHVAFTDSQGPRVFRAAPYALPLLLFCFAIFGPVHGAPATLTGLAAVGIFNLMGVVGFRQRKPRAAELECSAGYVDVKRSGSRNQRIRAQDITGATTARTRSGLLLTLQHRHRDQPVTIELANEADASKVRHALGIGHGGFGVLAWKTQPDSNGSSAFIGNWVSFGAVLLTLAISLAISHDAGLVVGILLGFPGFIGSVLGLGGLLSKGPQPTVVMTADGVRLRTSKGWFSLPYDGVRGIEEHLGGVAFGVPEPYHSVNVQGVGPARGGLSAADSKVLAAQIMAAAQRARGLGPQKDDVTGRLDVLRRNGENPRDWLVRLDMAGQMLSAGQGYRGNTLDAQDLWAILEDPEAEPDLRAAAARVLRHAPTPDARVRIDAAVAAVRDDATNRRLRIAIRDDLEGATEELAFLEATEAQAKAAPRDRAAAGR